MVIQKNVSLKNLNTFGIEAQASYYAEVSSTDELKTILSDHSVIKEPLLILGGGSNLLFTQNFNGLVLHNKIKGIKIDKETQEDVLVHAGAGELWHEFVLFCINKNLGGIENLSLIPGTVGASPIQNIGAYGVEIKDTFHSLEAFHIKTGETKIFLSEECNFGYRTSIFKTDLKGQYIITGVTFRLKKNPVFNTSYGAIQDTLHQMGIKNPTVKSISDAVIQIRRSKLPDPAEIGNAGSFFKNPEISLSHFDKIKSAYPDVPSYNTVPGMMKVPAGWLIEQCGWKGKVIGNTGVHKNQALVLVNYGEAKGNEIKELSKDIQHSVKEKFGVALETEVNII